MPEHLTHTTDHLTLSNTRNETEIFTKSSKIIVCVRNLRSDFFRIVIISVGIGMRVHFWVLCCTACVFFEFYMMSLVYISNVRPSREYICWVLCWAAWNYIRTAGVRKELDFFVSIASNCWANVYMRKIAARKDLKQWWSQEKWRRMAKSQDFFGFLLSEFVIMNSSGVIISNSERI